MSFCFFAIAVTSSLSSVRWLGMTLNYSELIKRNRCATEQINLLKLFAGKKVPFLNGATGWRSFLQGCEAGRHRIHYFSGTWVAFYLADVPGAGPMQEGRWKKIFDVR
jgi:hypothetical protein